MQLTPVVHEDGTHSSAFDVDGVPGRLWQPTDSTPDSPLLLLAHGGGQHKAHPAILGRVGLCLRAGFAAVAIDAPGHGDRPPSADQRVRTTELRRRMAAGESIAELLADDNRRAGESAAEWSAVLDAVIGAGLSTGRVAFWGVSMGSATGLHVLSTDSRIGAGVLGLVGMDGLADAARRVVAPVLFLMQWDDAVVRRDSALALFDALGSTRKTLHANPGDHADLPRSEHPASLAFLERVLRDRP